MEIVDVERKEEIVTTMTQQRQPIEMKFKKEKKRRTTETRITKMEVQVTESVFANSKHL